MLVLCGDPLEGINDDRHDVSPFDGPFAAQHAPILDILVPDLPGPSDSCGVDEYEFVSFPLEDAVDRIPCRPRHILDHDPILSGDGIDDARFPDVRPADNRKLEVALIVVLFQVLESGLSEPACDQRPKLGDSPPMGNAHEEHILESEAVQFVRLLLFLLVVRLVSDQYDPLRRSPKHFRDLRIELSHLVAFEKEYDDIGPLDDLFHPLMDILKDIVLRSLVQSSGIREDVAQGGLLIIHLEFNDVSRRILYI